MGHKVNPVGIRLNITRTSTAKWYAKPKEYAGLLLEDLAARTLIEKSLVQAGVSSIQIERPARNAKITIYVARPGVVIGKKGEFIESLRKKVEKIMSRSVSLSVIEVKKSDLDAKLVAENIAQQLERRVMYRRAMKRAVQTARRMGAGGIKIQVSGRLGGAEIARSERYNEGSVPLHTLRANIDYALAEAQTTYGKLGVKVWIYKGEIFDRSQISFAESAETKSQYSEEKDQRHFNRRRPPRSKPANKESVVDAH
jgi:small subunit ribosomal protein S3